MGMIDALLGRFGYARRPAPADDSAGRASLDAALDKAVGQAMAARRSFESAETPDWTHSWASSKVSVNDDLQAQLPTLRNRSRGLALNNEWARRYLLLSRDNIFGPAGIALQMRVKKRSGEPNDQTNKLIESAWARFGKRGNCDVSGRLSWRRLEWLVLNHLSVDGAYLFRIKRPAGPFGLLLQALNPNTLDHTVNRDYQGRRVRMGIEIDDEGRPLAYWLLGHKAGEADSWQGQQIGRHVRVPAEEIIHDFLPDFADQYDGFPALTVGARRLWLAQQYEEAASVASVNAARRVGFFITKDGEAPTSVVDTVISSVLDAARAQGKTLSPDEVKAVIAAAQKISTAVPGTFDTLPQGTEFQQFESAFPHVNHADFIKQSVRGYSAAQGISYHTLGNDLESVNYSSARVGISDEREHYKLLQEAIIEGFHDRVFPVWLEMALLRAPELKTLRADRLEEYVAAAGWQPRRWEGIDPAKEAAANEINLRLKTTSRRRLILQRGEDPDEIFDEVDQETGRFGEPDAAASQPAPDKEDTPAEPADTPDQAKSRALPARVIAIAPRETFLP